MSMPIAPAPVLQPPTVPAPPDCDLVVVGAGLVGLATARELLLRRPGLRIAILEREREVAAHQSGHNSGVVHAGIYYTPGSMKAQLCVAGARDLYRFCEERGVAHDRIGKLIVATEAGQLGQLEELERRGRANGVPGLRRVDAARMAEIEPHVRGVAALHSPDTGVVDFPGVARALARDAIEAGATLTTGCAVTALEERPGGGVELTHAQGRLRARRAVVCAGAWADVLSPATSAGGAGASSGAAGARPGRAGGTSGSSPARDVRIVPFRGAYRILREPRAELVKGLIYPVPDPALPFLGVHLTRGIDREVHVGPTALMVAARDAYRLARLVPADVAATLRWPGTYRMVRRWWRTGFDELRNSVSTRALAAAARRFVPELEAADLLPGPSGVRGQAVGRDGRLIDDFVIDETASALHVRNAPSPAATACLALGRVIADRCEDALGD